MSDWEDALSKRAQKPLDVKLARFPVSARESLRYQLHSIRLQMEALGLDEADLELCRAIVAVCAGLGIPNHLTVEQLLKVADPAYSAPH